MNTVQVEVDARGLNCPLPILRLRKAVNQAEAGNVLQLLASDPGSVKDVDAFCRQTGNTLLEAKQAGAEYRFLIRKEQ